NEAKKDPHFDTQSVRVFGGRYADVAAQLIYKIKPAGATISSLPDDQGRSVLLLPGSYSAKDLESNGIKASEILSLKVDDGYRVTLKTENGDKVFEGSLNMTPENFTAFIVQKK